MAGAADEAGLSFEGLIARLREVLEEDEDAADIDAIKEAMAMSVSCHLVSCRETSPTPDPRYKSSEADWEKYVHFDDHK